MELTDENYYSNEADNVFMSVSQYHNFVGTLAYKGCQAMAMAMLTSGYQKEKTAAMLVGSYVDAYFEGTLDEFKSNNPEIFTLKGELRAEYKNAEKIIAVAESDVYFTKFIYGSEKQVILTGEIGGVVWKGKLDYLFPDRCIVDLKVIKSITEKTYVDGFGKVNYIDASGYIDQAAIYQELVRQKTGKILPFYHAVLSKENTPDHEIIQIPQEKIDDALKDILSNLPSVLAVKNAEVHPHRCETCDYCKATKKLSSPKNYYDL